MTIEQSRNDQVLTLRLGGTGEPGDARELRTALGDLPRDPTPLDIDLSGLDTLPLGIVQVLWAYIRHARGIFRPVQVTLGPGHSAQAQAWGLGSGGWELYFHVG